MPQNSFSIQPFEAKRVRFDSTRSFDEVLLNLRKLVGTATLQEVNKQESGGVIREHVETLGEEYYQGVRPLDIFAHLEVDEKPLSRE